MLGRTFLAFASIWICATPATAQQVYQMSGKLARSFAAYDLPLAGDTPCPDLTLKVMEGTAAVATRHHFGCVPGAAKVTATGAGVGAAFTLPQNAFGQPLPASPRVYTFPNQNGVQITTSLAIAGPSAPAQLRADATQPGRYAPDFTWSASPGPNTSVIVKYTAGPNRFGGTIGFVVSAGANPTRLVLPGPLSGQKTFLPIATTGARPTGRGYAVPKTDPSEPGSAWAMTMATSMGRVTMGTTYLGPRPLLGSRMVHGFPFTTGQVVVRRTGNTLGPAKSPATVTLTATGGDSVTPMGARNLTLVAGSVAAYSKLGAGQIGLTQIALPEPGALLQRCAGVIGLLAIAAWRARRAH